MRFLSVSRHEKDTPRILSARSSSTLPIFLAHFWPDQPLNLSLSPPFNGRCKRPLKAANSGHLGESFRGRAARGRGKASP